MMKVSTYKKRRKNLIEDDLADEKCGNKRMDCSKDVIKGLEPAIFPGFNVWEPQLL